jgi:CRISPR-associated endonuclease Csn1
MAYRAHRLGLDVGTNSIGWFIVWLDAESEAYALGPGGVRIFPDGRDPQSGISNAADRRDARSARRRRDRYLRRLGLCTAVFLRRLRHKASALR